MDVDTSYGQERSKQSEEARVFAASDTLTIRLAASLPREVQQVLNTSGVLFHERHRVDTNANLPLLQTH